MNWEKLKEYLPDEVVLNWADYRDNLSGVTDLLDTCIEECCGDALWERLDEGMSDQAWEAIQYYTHKLRNDLLHDFDEEEVDEALELFEDKIIEHFYNVDDSDYIKDLCRNTSDIQVRMEIYSNYDCINSNHFEGGYEYPESYFADMVDLLRLNPKQVQIILEENSIKTFGEWPDEPNRIPLVTYDDFLRELINSCSPANLLTFVGTVDVWDLVQKHFKFTEITVPKGNYCGLFSSMYGGGSILEMKLLDDLTLKVGGGYPYTRLLIDKEHGYSIDETYGMSSDFYGDCVKLG